MSADDGVEKEAKIFLEKPNHEGTESGVSFRGKRLPSGRRINLRSVRLFSFKNDGCLPCRMRLKRVSSREVAHMLYLY